MAKYLSIPEMLELIDEPNRAACRRIYTENLTLFQTVPGSTHNHQAWPGGYHDHVQEAMNIAGVFYEGLGRLRALPFSLSDALLVVFLHDIEKPWKYELGPDGHLRHRSGMTTKADHQRFRERMLAEYGISLTPEQLNGLKYVEGELDDYTNRRRVMGPLAAFCHLADVTSARIWFAHPNDTWPGARRDRQ